MHTTVILQGVAWSWANCWKRSHYGPFFLLVWSCFLLHTKGTRHYLSHQCGWKPQGQKSTHACSSLFSSSLFRLANSLAPPFCLALPSNMNCWWSSTIIVGFRYAWRKSSNWDQWRPVFLSLSALFLHVSACITAGKKLGHELHSIREC